MNENQAVPVSGGTECAKVDSHGVRPARAFRVLIQFSNRVQRLSVVAATSIDALLRAFDVVEEGEPFGVTVQEVCHG